MVLNQKYVLLIVALIAVNLIFAQEPQGGADYEDSTPKGNQTEDGSGQSRIIRYSACNYTAQAGRTCANCRQTLVCLPSNIGLFRTCRGLFRYCNNGFCSYIGGSACDGITTG